MSVVRKVLLHPNLKTAAEDTGMKFNTFLTYSDSNTFVQNTLTFNLNTLLKFQEHKFIPAKVS